MVYANGRRKYKMTQFLTEEVGLPAFRQHLWQVVGIGNSVLENDEKTILRWNFPLALRTVLTQHNAQFKP